MRYAWDQFDAYFGPERIGARGSAAAAPGPGVAGPLGSRHGSTACTAISLFLNMLRGGSRCTIIASRPSCIHRSIPSSSRRDRVARQPAAFLIVSALVPYKRVDLAMIAARRAGVALTVVGDGPERARLERAGRRSASSSSGWQTDEEIRELYRSVDRDDAPRRRGLRHRAASRPRRAAARSWRSAAAARSRRSSTARPACWSTTWRSRRSRTACASRAPRTWDTGAHSRACRAVLARSLRARDRSRRRRHDGRARRSSDGKAPQPAARRLPRRHRCPARHGGVPAGLRHPLRHAG